MGLSIYIKRPRHITYDEGRTLIYDPETVYDGGTTHNLTKMADAAGIYEALWRPHRLHHEYDIPDGQYEKEWEFEDSHPIKAGTVIPALEKGLKDLKDRPEHFETFNSENGWGTYKHFVPFVEKFLEACREYPDGILEASR